MISQSEISETARFRATAGAAQGLGVTPRAALDALLAKQSEVFATPIVIWPFNRGDAFFSDNQQARMQDLKGRRDFLSVEEEDELKRLVEESFDATVARTKALQPRKT